LICIFFCNNIKQYNFYTFYFFCLLHKKSNKKIRRGGHHGFQPSVILPLNACLYQSQITEGSSASWRRHLPTRLVLGYDLALPQNSGDSRKERGLENFARVWRPMWVEALNFLVRRGRFGNLFFKKKVEGKYLKNRIFCMVLFQYPDNCLRDRVDEEKQFAPLCRD
jgi:hypothetical protein